jgi:hypothetical protein
LLNQACHLLGSDAGNKGFAVRGVSHDARHIGDLDELGGLKLGGQSRCRDVGVDI